VSLNEQQLRVLNWIGDGCPEGVMEDHTHRISAAALRNRDLVRIHGRGNTWRAELTGQGRAYLATPPPTQEASRRPKRPGMTGADTATAAGDATIGPSNPIPEDLRGAHRFIRSTRAAASGLKSGKNGLLEIGRTPGVIYMHVSRAQLQRALLLAHGMIIGAIKRGWEVVPYTERGYGRRPGVAIAVGEQRYPIEIVEDTCALPFTENEIERWRSASIFFASERRHKQPPPQQRRREPTGTLRLQLPNGYAGGRATWTDGTRSLNGHLDRVFETLDQRVIDDNLAVAARRQRQEEFAREQARREELAQLSRIEEARLARARAEVDAWRTAQELAAYSAALRNRIPLVAEAERERIGAWCDWIEQSADRADPVRHTELIVGRDAEQDGRGW
jgi:hypothetical protein